MAYDPNDATDKKIVDKLIKEALEAQAAEHETEIEGLKTQNKTLIGDLRKARQGKAEPEEIAALQDQLTESKDALTKANKDLAKVNSKLEEVNGKYAEETKYAQDLLIEGKLGEQLVAANVPAQFMPAVKALLKPQVTVKIDDKGRNAVVGDKSLGDYIKEWSQGDQGKPFIGAAVNGGVGANGGQKPNGGNGQGGKTMTRTQYEAAEETNPGSMASFFKEGGVLTE